MYDPYKATLFLMLDRADSAKQYFAVADELDRVIAQEEQDADDYLDAHPWEGIA